jgi:hypothetical protein
MINKRAKHYGAESSPSFLSSLSEKLKKDYGNFDAASFSFPGSKGVTMDGLYLLEMMSSFTKDTENSVNQKLREVVTQGYQRLFTAAGAKSGDIFFVAPKAAADPQTFDLTKANLHALSGVIEARKNIPID